MADFDDSDVAPATLIARLLDPAQRAELLASLSAEPWQRQLHHHFWTAATRAVATPDELRDVVRILLEEDQEALVGYLVSNEQMPEDVLVSLCDQGRCIDALGHRRGPRALLERVVEKHGYLEAVLTLALDLYADASATAEEFAVWARAHAVDARVLRALSEATPSEEAKERVYESLLGGHVEAIAFHARHLATSPRHSMGRLAAFLAQHAEPPALVLLLQTEIANEEKRGLVERLAEGRTDEPSIQTALTRRRWIDQAARDDLTPESAATLLATGDAKVLCSLASNARTPPAMLLSLGDLKGVEMAARIRRRARATLGDTSGPPSGDSSPPARREHQRPGAAGIHGRGERTLEALLRALEREVTSLEAMDASSQAWLHEETAGGRPADRELLEELIHVATHELGSQLSFLVRDLRVLSRRIAVRRRHVDALTDEEFETVISSPWSLELVRTTAAARGLRSPEELHALSRCLRELQAEWSAIPSLSEH